MVDASNRATKAHRKWGAAFAVACLAFFVLLGLGLTLVDGILQQGWLDPYVKPLAPPSSKEFLAVVAALIAASASLVAAGVTLWVLYGQVQEAKELEVFKAGLASAIAKEVGAQNRQTEKLKMVWPEKLKAYGQAKAEANEAYFMLMGQLAGGSYTNALHREPLLLKVAAIAGKIADLEGTFQQSFDDFHQAFIDVTHEASQIVAPEGALRHKALNDFWNNKAAKRIGPHLNALLGFEPPDAPWEEPRPSPGDSRA